MIIQHRFISESEDEQEGSETVIEMPVMSRGRAGNETEFENTETVAVLTGAFGSCRWNLVKEVRMDSARSKFQLRSEIRRSGRSSF